MKPVKSFSLAVPTLLVTLTMPFSLSSQPQGLIGLNSLAAWAKAPLLRVQEVLSQDDETFDVEGVERYVDIHEFTGKANQTVSIYLESDDFDPIVALLDANAEVMEVNDDLNDKSLNAGLTVTLPDSGEYYVLVTSVEPSGQGTYGLRVLPEN
ncbi:MAG: PPC domain-containing protein [Nodosilinea sp.]